MTLMTDKKDNNNKVSEEIKKEDVVVIVVAAKDIEMNVATGRFELVMDVSEYEDFKKIPRSEQMEIVMKEGLFEPDTGFVLSKVDVDNMTAAVMSEDEYNKVSLTEDEKKIQSKALESLGITEDEYIKALELVDQVEEVVYKQTTEWQLQNLKEFLGNLGYEAPSTLDGWDKLSDSEMMYVEELLLKSERDGIDPKGFMEELSKSKHSKANTDKDRHKKGSKKAEDDEPEDESSTIKFDDIDWGTI